MKEKNNIDKTLEKYITRGDHHGMKVPDGYFDAMQRSVLSKVEVQALPARRVSLRTWLALAASLTVVAIIAVATLQKSSSGIEVADFEEIASDEAYAYIYQNADEFTAEEIFSALDINEQTEVDALGLEETNYAIDQLLEELSGEDLEAIF